jgi:hypothetical protein
MFGTASTAEAWLLLEYNGSWSRDLLNDSDLPPEVKARLAEALRTLPEARLLFIRNELRGKAGLSFFVAVSREDCRRLYRFELDDYAELLGIDLVGLAAGAVEDDLRRVDDPLYLVCVDGKHDKCCAKFGLPVWRAMVRAGGEAVWQSSHLGGDRFAANVACLPSGIYYGQVTPEDAQRIVEDTAAGRLYLEKLRGRVYYGFSVQAAEYFARVAGGLLDAEALTLEGIARSDRLVRVSFREPSAGRTHRVELARESDSPGRLLTCTAEAEHQVPRFVLRSYRVE